MPQMPKIRTETFFEPTEADDLTVTVAQRDGVRQVALSCSGGQTTWNPADDAALDAALTVLIKQAIKVGAPKMGF